MFNEAMVRLGYRELALKETVAVRRETPLLGKSLQRMASLTAFLPAVPSPNEFPTLLTRWFWKSLAGRPAPPSL